MSSPALSQQAVQETSPRSQLYHRAYTFSSPPGAEVQITYRSSNSSWANADLSLTGNHISREVRGVYRSTRATDSRTGMQVHTIELGRSLDGEVNVSVNGRQLGSNFPNQAAEVKPQPVMPSENELQRRIENRRVEQLSELRLPQRENAAPETRGRKAQPPAGAEEKTVTPREGHEGAVQNSAGIALESRAAGHKAAPIVDAQAQSVMRRAGSAGYGIALIAKNGVQETYKMYHGEKWVEPGVTVPGNLSSNERDRFLARSVERLLEAERASDRVPIHCADAKREVPALSPADGELYRVMRDEFKKPGGLALAFTGLDALGQAQYCIYRTGHIAQGKKVEPQWIGKAFPVSSDLSPSERNALLLERVRLTFENPPIEIAKNSAHDVRPVELATDAASYQTLKRAQAEGYSFRLKESRGAGDKEQMVFALHYKGVAVGHDIVVPRAGEDYFQKRDAALAAAAERQMANPPVVIRYANRQQGESWQAVDVDNYPEARQALVKALGDDKVLALRDCAIRGGKQHQEIAICHKDQPEIPVGPGFRGSIPENGTSEQWNSLFLHLAEAIPSKPITPPARNGDPSGMIRSTTNTAADHQLAAERVMGELTERYPTLIQRLKHDGFRVDLKPDSSQSTSVGTPRYLERKESPRGLFVPESKAAEVFVNYLDAEKQTRTTSPGAVRELVMHELGHALAWYVLPYNEHFGLSGRPWRGGNDAHTLLNGYGVTASEEGHSAYAKDLATLPKQWLTNPPQGPFSYELQPGEVGAQEAFARAASIALSGDDSAPSAQHFIEHFPETYRFAKKLVEAIDGRQDTLDI